MLDYLLLTEDGQKIIGSVIAVVVAAVTAFFGRRSGKRGGGDGDAPPASPHDTMIAELRATRAAIEHGFGRLAGRLDVMHDDVRDLGER